MKCMLAVVTCCSLFVVVGSFSAHAEAKGKCFNGGGCDEDNVLKNGKLVGLHNCGSKWSGNSWLQVIPESGAEGLLQGQGLSYTVHGGYVQHTRPRSLGFSSGLFRSGGHPPGRPLVRVMPRRCKARRR